MRALDAWRHYLLRSPSPVQVFTNHKNLTYFRQPQKLNHRQARWLLDLSEFDLHFSHIPGRDLCAPDALSHCPDHIPSSDSDNEDVTLLPDTLFVNLIDAALSDQLATSSATDPLVLDALHALPRELPAKFRSCLSDWKYNAGILTFQNRVYVPADSDLRRSVVSRHHDHPTAGHPGVLKTCQLVASEFWWPGQTHGPLAGRTECANRGKSQVVSGKAPLGLRLKTIQPLVCSLCRVGAPWDRTPLVCSSRLVSLSCMGLVPPELPSKVGPGTPVKGKTWWAQQPRGRG